MHYFFSDGYLVVRIQIFNKSFGLNYLIEFLGVPFGPGVP